MSPNEPRSPNSHTQKSSGSSKRGSNVFSAQQSLPVQKTHRLQVERGGPHIAFLSVSVHCPRETHLLFRYHWKSTRGCLWQMALRLEENWPFGHLFISQHHGIVPGVRVNFYRKIILSFKNFCQDISSQKKRRT